METYDKKDYTFDLPSELIAQEAVHPAHDARLIVCDRDTGKIIRESQYRHLPEMLGDDRVIFFNNSRVLPARITLEHAQYRHSDGTTGTIDNGEILFCQKRVSGDFDTLVRPGNRFRVGTVIEFHQVRFEVISLSESGRILRAHGMPIEDVMREYGKLPLPPYIIYDKEKEKDYQTRFAEKDGSVAAPTASLHFTDELLGTLTSKKEYVTLHVGLGTFKGINVSDIREYAIHHETVEISLSLFEKIYTYHQENKILTAVGTTVCRTLESLPSLWHSLPRELQDDFDQDIRSYWDQKLPPTDTHWIHHLTIDPLTASLRFETSIYIIPGYKFQIVDELITNFHLPESSLLVLISAFMGRDHALAIYNHAIEERYRFYSLGDGMYIRRGHL